MEKKDGKSFYHPLKWKEIKHLQSKYWKKKGNAEHTGRTKYAFFIE